MSESTTRFRSRRAFLSQLGHGVAACAVAGSLPRWLGATTPATDTSRALVLVQLAGGLDGFGTFIAPDDDLLRRARPTLAPAAHDLVSLDRELRVPRAAGAFESLFKDGQLGIIPRVLGPDPLRGHHRATEIWHTADDAELPVYSGWLGRCMDTMEAQNRPVQAWHGGSRLPRVFVRDRDLANRGRVSAQDDRAPLATAMDDPVVQLAEVGARAGSSPHDELHFVSFPGFDTHYDQTGRHAVALARAADALNGMQRAFARRGVDRRVLTIVFSEFGRSVAENHQGGTEHDRIAPVLLLGPAARAGLQTAATTPDFRSVLTTVAADWLRVPATVVCASPVPALSLLS